VHHLELHHPRQRDGPAGRKPRFAERGHRRRGAADRDQASSFEDSGWAIAGQAVGNQSGGMSFEGTVHGILANKVDALDAQTATIDGSVVSNQGVFGGFIGGSVITGQL
jgi:hypothetical protein